MMNNKLYNALKWAVITGSPALMTCLSIVLPAVGVSAETTNTIITVMGAVTVCVGTWIGVSSVQYAKKQEE